MRLFIQLSFDVVINILLPISRKRHFVFPVVGIVFIAVSIGLIQRVVFLGETGKYNQKKQDRENAFLHELFLKGRKLKNTFSLA